MPRLFSQHFIQSINHETRNNIYIYIIAQIIINIIERNFHNETKNKIKIDLSNNVM